MYQRLQREGEDDAFKQERRVLLMGKTGSGKSTTGNIIFNDRVFLSEISSSSVTKVCQPHTGSVNNRSVTVIDTPDFRFSTHTDFDSDSELMKALELCSPGAHVILLILPLSTFTEQEMEFIDWFQQKFGAESLRFTLVLFTHADRRHMRSLGEMIRRNNKLSDFINRCGQRCHEFNIKDLANRRQVTELMEKIDRMLSENRNSCYTLDMMLENEKRRKEEERRAEQDKRAEEEMRTEEEMRERKGEEERREREHQMELERIRKETQIRVKREFEQERAKVLESTDKAGKREKLSLLLQIKLKYVGVLMVCAVVTGGVLMHKEDSLQGWTFMRGFVTGGSAAAAGVFTGILWRLMWKSQYTIIGSSSHEYPSAVRQFFLKTAGVVCGGLFARAVIHHFVGENLLHVSLLAGAAGAFTAIH